MCRRPRPSTRLLQRPRRRSHSGCDLPRRSRHREVRPSATRSSDSIEWRDGTQLAPHFNFERRRPPPPLRVRANLRNGDPAARECPRGSFVAGSACSASSARGIDAFMRRLPDPTDHCLPHAPSHVARAEQCIQQGGASEDTGAYMLLCAARGHTHPVIDCHHIRPRCPRHSPPLQSEHLDAVRRHAQLMKRAMVRVAAVSAPSAGSSAASWHPPASDRGRARSAGHHTPHRRTTTTSTRRCGTPRT